MSSPPIYVTQSAPYLHLPQFSESKIYACGCGSSLARQNWMSRAFPHTNCGCPGPIVNLENLYTRYLRIKLNDAMHSQTISYDQEEQGEEGSSIVSEQGKPHNYRQTISSMSYVPPLKNRKHDLDSSFSLGVPTNKPAKSSVNTSFDHISL